MDLVIKKVKSSGMDELGGKDRLEEVRNQTIAIQKATEDLSIPLRIERELSRLA
ncbi:hypothetical protein F5883DRAFT_653819 [Diaporthe sp. PMI_573]|nr:hypothetical protein F5883DRAFT_653819 [Diaporthaceae sp. PMI_573]